MPPAKKKVKGKAKEKETVRATQIVQKAAESDILPPDFAIDELSGLSRKPTIQEFKDVLDMQFLVYELADHYDNIRSISWDHCTETCSVCIDHWFRASDNIDPDAWEPHLQRSFYRIFLIVAVLSRHYQEPFFPSPTTPPGFIKALTKNKPSHLVRMTRKIDIQYLESFPIYKSSEYEKLDDIFGPLVTWMTDENNLRSKTEKYMKPEVIPDNVAHKTLNGKELALLQEILHLLGAFTFLVDSPHLIWSEHLKKPTVRFSNKRAKLLKAWGKESVKAVPVVMMDYYQMGEIFVLPNVSSWHEDEDDGGFGILERPILQKKGRYTKPDTRVAPSQNIAGILNALYKQSNRPNHCNGHPAPPLNLQLFTYILRKCFNLRFSDDFFVKGGRSEVTGNYEWISERFIDPSCRSQTSHLASLVSADDVPFMSYAEIK